MPSPTHGEAEKDDEGPRSKAGPVVRRADEARTAGRSDDHRRRLQRLGDSASATERADLLRSLQRSHGNQYVQRLLASGEAGEPRLASPLPDGGRPLETPVQRDMEDRLGAPLSGVRIHTDAPAADAARALRARAFTSGQDVYFAGGAYQPSTPAGQALLAHELTHTLQQRGATPGTMAELAVAPPDDPLERQAERVADQVVRGGRADVPLRAGSAGPARMIHRQPADAPATPAGDPEADFVIRLGAGLKIKRADLKAAQRKGRYEKDLSALSLPGLKVKRLVLNLDRETGAVRKGDVGAVLDVPFVRLVGRDETRFEIDEEGKTSFRAKAKLAVPAVGSPVIDVGLSEGAVSASATLTAEKLKPPGIPKLKVPSASVTVGLAEGKLAGKGEATLEYPGLARGDFAVEFKDGQPSGKGKIDLIPDYLKGVQASLEIAEGNLQGELSVPASKLSPPVPGLKITEGTLTVGMKNGQLSGAGEGIKFEYRGLGDGIIGFTIKKDRLEGAGSLNLTIPGLTPVKGQLRYRDGNLSGQATITADKFPKGLPVKGGQITVLVDEKGGIAGRGAVRVDLFGVGEGELKLGYEKGILDVSAEVALRKIPGLEEGRVLISLKDGQLEGAGTIAVAPKQIPGLAGSLTVAYKEDRFSGKGKIGYAKGKIAGSVELFVAQDEKGKLAMSGSGEVTARLTDWLTGMVHIDVYPDTKTKIAGQLKADDVKLFPEKKADRELFNISKNIPLWAILVAVIRARGGVRAGVGPGLLRGVTADGTFSTAEGEEPTFSIRGELFIPGYAEAYLAFGVGLGLDVLIGELTGGIEAVATAGIYGAVSVIPVIEYDGTDFSISGTATLAAGAKVKLGLQAWAEVEALWITVWENTWKLAEWVWDVGPTLAMQANMKYVFGRPEAPTFDFKTSDIDAERLVTDAMPKDGPRGSGAREALKNSSEWKGLLKEQRKDPSVIPPELAEKSAKAPVPKAPPPKKAKGAPPPEALKDPAKAKEAALKDLKAKDGAAPTKPIDKSHEEKLNKGMAALEKLRVKSQTDPEDPDEIAKHLEQIKAEHGFTKISYELKGEEWIIDAAMSPGRPSSARAQRDPAEEGEVGTYSSLQGRRGDRITPDHEPQDGLMSYIRDDLRFQRRKPFKDTSVADYGHGRGICLNMFQDRHYQTRTYGAPAVLASAKGRIREAVDKLPENATDKRVQRTVAKVMNEELKADHQTVKDIYRNSRLQQSTKDRVTAALPKVKSENRAAYPEAFDE